MKKLTFRIIAAITAVVFLCFAAGCSTSTEYNKRQEQNQQSASKSTLEKANLKKKLALEEDPNRVGYITLLAGVSGKPFGYYAVKGKISNSSSQIDPEDLVDCGTGPASGGSVQDYCVAIDGPQDDGTYGGGDDGVFFFTTDGTYVEFTGDYVYSTQPLPSSIDIPKLG